MKIETGYTSGSGNIPFDGSVECSFDEGGIGHIMYILSNMYSDKYLAVLREYSCNARDSHVESGQTRPIEVTLPSSLQPSLIVKDYGIGLSKEGILNTYGVYGKSTKRDSNDQVGALGIGSKAAFTMGQQFVVAGVKDGVKTVVLFALNEDNVGTMTVLSEGPTDEPNGVEVSLAVPDVRQMRETAEQFFSTWPEGVVLVNGAEPAHVYNEENTLRFTDTVYRNGDWDDNYAVMGGVPYPLSTSLLSKVDHPKASSFGYYGMRGFFFEIPIGSADIAPSREALRDTPRTLATLKDVFERLVESAQQAAEEAVASATTWREAHMAFLQWSTSSLKSLVDTSAVEWNGKPVNKDSIEATEPVVYMYRKPGGFRDYTATSFTGYRITSHNCDKIAVVVVDAVNQSKVSRFAKRFMESKGLRGLVLSQDAKGGYEWFEWGPGHPVEVLTFEEYREHNRSLRAPRGTKPRTTIPRYATGHFGAEIDTESREPLDEIVDDGGTLIVWHENMRGRFHERVFTGIADKGTEITLLATQTVESLQKHLANLELKVEIRTGYEVAKEVTEELVASLTDDQKRLVALNKAIDAFRYQDWDDMREWVNEVKDDVELINDDILNLFAAYDSALAELSKHSQQEISEAQTITSMANASVEDAFTVPNRCATYPLLPSYFYRVDKVTARHLVHYLNGLALAS